MHSSSALFDEKHIAQIYQNADSLEFYGLDLVFNWRLACTRCQGLSYVKPGLRATKPWNHPSTGSYLAQRPRLGRTRLAGGQKNCISGGARRCMSRYNNWCWCLLDIGQAERDLVDRTAMQLWTLHATPFFFYLHMWTNFECADAVIPILKIIVFVPKTNILKKSKYKETHARVSKQLLND